MRIAVWHNLPSGGAKRALYDQVRGLIARGHEVEAWCPWTANQTYLPLADLMPEHVLPLGLKAYSERVPTLPQKLHPLYWSARGRLKAMERHCRECAGQIQGKGFDLLFAGPCMFYSVSPIARFLKIPRVLYLQEPNRTLYEAQPELPWVASSWSRQNLSHRGFVRSAVMRRLKLSGIRVQAREERISVMAFDRVLVNSFFSRESLLRAYGVDSRVCYLGVDTEGFVRQGKTRGDFAICVAAIYPPKNIEFLIRALSKVGASLRPKLYLVANIVDRGYMARIKELAARLNVEIELKHRIGDEELIDLLNRARMLLYAPRLEPFGLAPLEANACGLPVIAVAEGGVRETVQDGVNGLLVDPEPECMAEAIERLLADDELHDRLSQSAYKLAREKWSLPFSVDRLERMLIEEVARHRSQVQVEQADENSLSVPSARFEA